MIQQRPTANSSTQPSQRSVLIFTAHLLYVKSQVVKFPVAAAARYVKHTALTKSSHIPLKICHAHSSNTGHTVETWIMQDLYLDVTLLSLDSIVTAVKRSRSTAAVLPQGVKHKHSELQNFEPSASGVELSGEEEM